MKIWCKRCNRDVDTVRKLFVYLCAECRIILRYV
jgi:hypothetical protein